LGATCWRRESPERSGKTSPRPRCSISGAPSARAKRTLRACRGRSVRRALRREREGAAGVGCRGRVPALAARGPGAAGCRGRAPCFAQAQRLEPCEALQPVRDARELVAAEVELFESRQLLHLGGQGGKRVAAKQQNLKPASHVETNPETALRLAARQFSSL